MKLPLLCALLLAAAPAAVAADGPELHGMIVTSSEQRFLVSPKPGAKGEWVGVGESVGDWKVAEFRPKDQLLVLKNGDQESDLALASANTKQGDAPTGTLADAQRLFDKMHFAEVFAKILDQQQAMFQRQMAQSGKQLQRQLQGRATPQEIADFQKQVMDKLWGGIDKTAVVGEMTKIYSESFSSDELNAMTAFYDTPSGQAMIAKTPEIQGKISSLIQSQIQQQIPAVQQLQRQFMEAHAPNAAGTGAPGATAAPAAPAGTSAPATAAPPAKP